MAVRTITLHGRTTGVQGNGDPASRRIVLFCHPTPGSCVLDPDPVITEHADVHLVGIDRPGYGASEPLPLDAASSIADRADDLAEFVNTVLAEAMSTGDLQDRRIGVVGWSGGGRIALALAARHPDLIDRVAVVATPAPDSAVHWVPEDLASMNAALADLAPATAKERLGAMLAPAIPTLGNADLAALGATDADDSVLAGLGVRGRMTRMLDEAYRQGSVGLVDDLLSIVTDDWGFDPGAIRAKTLLVYGADDRQIGSAHGRWYRHRIPRARLRVVPHVGQLVIVPAWHEVLAHVAPESGPEVSKGS